MMVKYYRMYTGYTANAMHTHKRTQHTDIIIIYYKLHRDHQAAFAQFSTSQMKFDIGTLGYAKNEAIVYMSMYF